MLKTLFPITLVLSVALASVYPTITFYYELERAGFNDRSRHGLKLLTWFVLRCLDENMVDRCNPTTGEFGCHRFLNDKWHLLPQIWDRRQYTYFTIGNLNAPFSDHLPPDVRRLYDPWNPVSNMDRLVMKYNNYNRRIEEIYISADYERSKTYQISPDLIKNLQSGCSVASLICRDVF